MKITLLTRHLMRYALLFTLLMLPYLGISQTITLKDTLRGKTLKLSYLDEKGEPINNVTSQKIKLKPNQYVKGQVIVKFKDGYLDHDVLNLDSTDFNPTRLIKDKNLRIRLSIPINGRLKRVVEKARPKEKYSLARTGEPVIIPDFYNLMYLQVSDSTDIPDLCEKLSQLPGIEYAEPNAWINKDTPPNDPRYASQKSWEQANDIDIDLESAWNITMGSNSVKVGIVDTGIDYANRDLGNGSYGTATSKVTGGKDYQHNDSNPDDDDTFVSHGTSVAGIIGAYTNNNEGVSGIAGGNVALGNPGVQLVALKVGTDKFEVGSTVNAIYDAAKSISAGGFGCHIINYSGGSNTAYNSERQAISFAALNRVVFVASKGNDGSSSAHFPSDYADNIVLSVGWSNDVDLRDGSSNFGNSMDVVAPAFSIVTTKSAEDNFAPYGPFTGTSAAAPVVSGIAALLKSVNLNLHPDDIEQIIQIGADKGVVYPYVNGYNQEMGYGRVNAGTSLSYMAAPWVFTQSTATGGLVVGNSGAKPFVWLNDAGNGLPDGWYYGTRYEVRKTVTIPASACNQRFVWTRTAGATRGYSGADPNNQLGWSDITSTTAHTAELRTFVYFIEYVVNGQTLNQWYPCSPDQVSFAYSTLIHTPIDASITGSTVACSSNAAKPSFSITKKTAGTSVSWSATPASFFNPSVFTGDTFSPAIIAGSVGSATISATLTGSACGNIALPDKAITITGSAPTLTSPTVNGKPLSTPYRVCPTYFYTLKVTAQNNASPVSWQLASGSATFYPSTDGTASVGNIQNGASVQITAKATNACGTSTVYFSLRGDNTFCTSGRLAAEEVEAILNTYPNPADQYLQVSLNGQEEALVEGSLATTGSLNFVEAKLYNSLSQVVWSEKAAQSPFRLETTNLPSGTYFLLLLQSDKIIRRQIVIRH